MLSWLNLKNLLMKSHFQKMGYIDIFTNLENNMAIKNDVQLILFGVKLLIDLIG